MFRDNYKEIRAAAQAAANLDGYDRGIDRDAFGFRSFMLPRRENRCGHEYGRECPSDSPRRGRMGTCQRVCVRRVRRASHKRNSDLEATT